MSHKELFNVYFPPSKVECPDDKLKNTSILKMVDKAVNKVKVQHEWGHTSSAFLFFTLKIKNILPLLKERLSSLKNLIQKTLK